MTDQPIHDERLLEAIEACRPGSDDVADPALSYLADALAADPELEKLYQRLQQVDATLAGLFRDVPVPEGLQERLAARIEPAPSVVREPSRFSRRRMLTGGLVGAAVVFISAVCLYVMRPSPSYTPAMVLGQAIDVFTSPAGATAEFPNKGVSANHPITSAVAAPLKPRWRPIRDFLGRRGVAYDLTIGASRAVLYVFNSPVKGLSPNRPTKSQHTTQGCAAAAWIEGERMYVLVVEDDRPQVFKIFLRPHRVA